MKLALTGGAGFLGYHVFNSLSDKFDEISVLDIEPIDTNEYPGNARYIKTDVRDLDKLKEAFSGMDIVVHAAAALPLWKPQDIFDINVDGTRNVMEAALANGIKRVVYVSSTAVYGVPEKHPIYEDDPRVGVGAYGESKIEAENVCIEYREKGMCVPIVRPKTFIGTARLGVFQILYDWVECGKKIPVIGNGKNRYQLLEVEDLVNVIYLLLTLPPEKANSTFNAGAEKFDTVSEDVGALCKFASTGSTVMPTSATIVKPVLALLEAMKLSPLYKWVYGTADTDSFVSTEKAKQELGWSPEYSNSDALIRSYKWYLEHKDTLASAGITHRVPWKQGILSLFKRFL